MLHFEALLKAEFILMNLNPNFKRRLFPQINQLNFC